MRTLVAFLGLLTIGVIISGTVCAATYGGGSGTPEDPYQIWDPNQMNAIGTNPPDWNKHYKLMADIDMSAFTGTHYHIIGDSTTAFTGTFDGNGHVIGNLTYTTTDAVDQVGLFGLTSDATIRNLGVENVSLSSGGDSVGGLVGENYRSTLTGCYTTGSVSGNGNVGGLVGWNFESTLIACYATGSVSGDNTVGGLVGGLAGYVFPSTLTACYATGPASGVTSVGGLVGDNVSGTVTDCYATGSINGVRWFGGLVGYNWTVGSGTSTYTSCFWDVQTSNLADGVGNLEPDPNGITGLDTTTMMMPSTFTSAGWDFVGESINGTTDMWRMCEEGVAYPRLAREFSIGGDYACPDGVETEDLDYLAQRWLATAPDSIGAADGNLDGIVNIEDFAIMGSKWMMEAIETGSLVVTISPQGAIDAGAQWRRVGTIIWFNSGDTESGIAIGEQTVEFKPINGWSTPESQGITINTDQTADASGTYTQQTGSLVVTISPQGAIDAGAQWRRVGTTPWFNSGDTESGITIGEQTLEFKAINGWNTPESQGITINGGQTADASGTYTPMIPEGLVAHWTMNDNTSNKVVVDSGDRHLNGTAQRNTSALTVAGKVDTALAFNGTTDWIDCGTNVALLPDAWTLCAWIRCDNVITPMLISFGANYPSIKLQNTSDGKPRIHLGQSNYRYFAASAWTTLKDGQWHHVAFSVPGKGQTDIEQAMMYVDGVAVVGDPAVKTSAQAAKTHVYLGANPPTGTQRFGGAMDDVMLFNRVLSASEINHVKIRE